MKTTHKPTLLRETENFRIETSARGIRITAKAKNTTPRSRVVPRGEWDNYLKSIGSDRTSDAACVLDFGVGVFSK